MTRHAQRGFTLLVAMLVLLVATLLVVGAIAFTGSEMAAASHTMSAEKLNACAQAGRSMYLARVIDPLNKRGLSSTGADVPIDQISFDETLTLATNQQIRVRSGHFAVTATINSAGTIVGGGQNNITSKDVNDESNMSGDQFGAPGFYKLVATCQDLSTKAEQEVEFYVRLGGI